MPIVIPHYYPSPPKKMEWYGDEDSNESDSEIPSESTQKENQFSKEEEHSDEIDLPEIKPTPTPILESVLLPELKDDSSTEESTSHSMIELDPIDSARSLSNSANFLQNVQY